MANPPNNSNYYLAPVIFIPSALLITAITNAFPAVITATVPETGSNTYIPGQVIVLNIPYAYGMQQANRQQVKIISINGLNFTVNMDSTNYDLFVIPSGNVSEPASFAPGGSRNLSYNNNTNQVAFQPLNNVGN